MLSFKPTFSLSSFTFSKRLFSDYYSSSKGVKADGAIKISGGKINVSTAGKNAEGIESKTSI